MSARAQLPTLFACLWLAACGASQEPALAPPLGAAAPTTRFQEGRDPLSLAMQSIAKQLESVQTLAAREAFRGFLTTGSRATHRLTLPGSTCATLLAIASRGVHDMDAALYGDEGDLLALDSQPDAHPTMQVCTGAEARTLYYVLQVYEGAGSYLIVPFVGPPSSLEAVSRLLGTQTTVARLGQPSAEGPQRVSAFSEGLERRGFEALQAPLRVSLSADQRVRVELPTVRGACYTVAGFAVSGIENVDLRVLDDEGVEVARDLSIEQDAGVQFCTDDAGAFAAELHGVTGAGEALMLVFRVDAAAIGGASGLWLGERPLTAAATLPLADAVALATRRATHDGFKLTRSLRTGQLAQGQVVDETILVPAKRCARVEAVRGPGLRQVVLSVRGASAKSMGQLEAAERDASVHVCSTSARELSVQIHAVSGFGPYAVLVHEGATSSLVPAGADERIGERLQQVYADARGQGFAPHPLFEVGPRRLALAPDTPVATSVPIESASCVRAYVVSKDGSARAHFRSAGKPLGSVAASDAPAKACLRGTATQGLELELASDGSATGDAWLMVFVR